MDFHVFNQLSGPLLIKGTFTKTIFQKGPVINDGEMSENCLTINVIRPSGIGKASSLPVMVWIHGGSLISGDSLSVNDAHLVAHSIRMVSKTMRLCKCLLVTQWCLILRADRSSMYLLTMCVLCFMHLFRTSG